MKNFDRHDEKANHSKAIDTVNMCQPLTISENGNPAPTNKASIATEAKTQMRIGFMEGAFTVPDDFDLLGTIEIEAQFLGNTLKQHI